MPYIRNMDRILDIDLDFFLNKITDASKNGRRLKKKKYYPWSIHTLQSFLENRCLLVRKKPIPGKIVKHHDEAFTFWRELILTKKLNIPFELVHIDAHSDIGVADWGWIYITSELLHKPIEERIYPDESLLFGINEANYIAFALACRWIKKLIYILHPKWEKDLLKVHFKDYDIRNGYIQLKKFDKKELLEKGFEIDRTPLDVEPEIPVEFIPHLEYRSSQPFTLITVSHSKNFTPKTSDKLIRVIKKYIRKV
ncbi:MAG: UPF0489 family protein [Promethearchaeota archaeon]